MLSRFHLIPERYGQTDRVAISIPRVSVVKIVIFLNKPVCYKKTNFIMTMFCAINRSNIEVYYFKISRVRTRFTTVNNAIMREVN